MKRENRSKLVVKLDAAVRFALLHSVRELLGYVVISEYPRSGGSWFGEMVSEYTGLAFPRNRFPHLKPCIMHGHYLHSPALGEEKVICVMRDGRDAIVSEYFKRFFVNPDWSKREERQRSGISDPEQVMANMPRFIDYIFGGDGTGRLGFDWPTFVRSWLGRDVPFVKYEDLLTDPVNAMSVSLEKGLGISPDRERLGRIVERHRFERVANRSPGEERPKSTVRKGIAGDWKNKFSPQACRVFARYAGEELIELGYEDDFSWVDNGR